jgi:VanZ family protein
VRIFYFLPAIFWTITIVVLSILPASEFNGFLWAAFPFADLLVHFILYAILSFLICLPLLLCGRHNKTTTFIFSFLPALLLGIFTEILQFCLAPTRTASFTDILANSLGAVAGIILCFQIKKLFPSRFS